MLQFFSRYKFFAVVLFVLSSIIISIIYSILKPNKKLLVYKPEMVNAELVDTTVQYIRKYHKIADFNLTNQNGEKVTMKCYYYHIALRQKLIVLLD